MRWIWRSLALAGSLLWGFAAIANAQTSGLYWQCVLPSSVSPQGTFCPVSTTYPMPVQGAAGGVSTNVAIVPSNSTAISIAPIAASNATSDVLLAQPGNVYGAYAVNRVATAGFLILYNATAAPAPGALTAGLVLGCIPLPASGLASINYNPGPPAQFNVGAVALVSSGANCVTYTTGTITADIFGSAK